MRTNRFGLRARVAAVAVAIAAVPVALSAPSFAQTTTTAKAGPIVIKMASSKLGNIMVDEKGLSLYMFVPDARNVSNCEGQCLVAWPPIMLGAGQTLDDVKLDGDTFRRSLLGVALRADGSRHVTYNGWPLYYWFRDRAAGDVLGQWVGNVWFVMNQHGEPVTLRA
jgi:predicted lipoprotein with Yx(FWY)xxD motif